MNFRREIRILLHYPIYGICMVVLPLVVTLFFTSLMQEGQPLQMPIGIVDLDNTSTTRQLTRMLDAYQNTRIVAHYQSEEEARRAIQRNEIYAFMLFPRNLTQNIISGRTPKMSFYYTNTTLLAGALIYKEMRVISTLANAAVGRAVMQAKGYTPRQIRVYLQPIVLDTHQVVNPWLNYNAYLSAMLIPGAFLLFVFLITVYSLGTEIKFGRLQEWLDANGGSIYRAVLAKLLPQTAVFFGVFLLIVLYMYGVLSFPITGGVHRIMLLALLSILASQGFATFIFGLIPSLRMSMSVCSLWAVLSFSMVGTAFPVFAMDAPLQALAWLFPLRHYYLIYQLCVFDDFPLSDAWPHILALLLFMTMPLLVIRRMHRSLLKFGYQP
ncbi:MAG: ABC transporter permease [Prevotella sp.]|nr:ABC transporter permease [Prevotella sp.]